MVPLIKVLMPAKDLLMPKLEKVLYSGFIAEGDEVYQFEKRFSTEFGLPIALGMSSGTAALHASLLLSGVQLGDEVITTSMTAEPTNTSILQAGAVPVFADVDENSGNLDPQSVRACITPKTKAVVVVHYAGFPAKMGELVKIAEEFNLKLIEDCAHALGARYANESIGTIGDFGIFSFQAIKHMTTVDGGLLTFKQTDLEKQAKKIRWFGMEKGVPRTEVDITNLGYKYNMHNVAATIGLVQLDGINAILQKHIENGRYFDLEMAKISGLGITTFDKVAKPSYWLYTVFSDDSEDIERKLADVGVMASKLHRPNHYHSIFKPFVKDLPQLERYYKKMVHIPCGWWVTNEDRELIIDTLKKG